MAEIFTMEPIKPGDKYICIHGPDLRIAVDHDDVDHPRVEDQARRMVRTLNEYWDRG